MSETAQPTPDSAGVTRTPEGAIAPSPAPIDTPPKPTETIVRPPPTPSTTQSTTQEAKSEPPKADKSLVNEAVKEEGAPEKYEDFKVPEGFELDKDVTAEATALFKKHNLTQSSAQELVDFYINKTKEAQDSPYKMYEEVQQKWRNDISSDPEIGGSKLNGVKVSIGKLIDSFGDSKIAEAFREAMDLTGAGNNPAVVKGLYRLALRLTEGGAVRGNGPSTEGQRVPGSAAPSAAQAIYPHLPSTQR